MCSYLLLISYLNVVIRDDITEKKLWFDPTV